MASSPCSASALTWRSMIALRMRPFPRWLRAGRSASNAVFLTFARSTSIPIPGAGRHLDCPVDELHGRRDQIVG